MIREALLRTGLGSLGHDVANVVTRIGTENIGEALGALLALGAQAIAAAGLLAVADEIDRRARGGGNDRSKEEEGDGLHLGRFRARVCVQSSRAVIKKRSLVWLRDAVHHASDGANELPYLS